MAMKAPIKSADEWQDFFGMPENLQEAEARLVKSTIFAQPDGPSMWDDVMAFLGPVATIAGDLTGVGTALQFFRALV